MKKNEIRRQDNLRQDAEVAKLDSIFDLEVQFFKGRKSTCHSR